MRLRDPRVIHLLALYALPVVVAAAGWGVPAAIGTALAAFLLGVAARLFVSLRALRQPERPLRLHTITFSHYAEKARWCLDRLGVPYEEVPNVGVLGVLLTGRTVPWLEVPPGLTRISDSSRILRYLWGEYAGRLPGDRTWFLEPTPAALELEARLDRRLGNDVRVWLYHHLLRETDLSFRSWGIEEPAIPRWQRALLWREATDPGFRRAPDARRNAGPRRPGLGAHARSLRRDGPAARRWPALPDRRDADFRRHHVCEPRCTGGIAARIPGQSPRRPPHGGDGHPRPALARRGRGTAGAARPASSSCGCTGKSGPASRPDPSEFDPRPRPAQN